MTRRTTFPAAETLETTSDSAKLLPLHVHSRARHPETRPPLSYTMDRQPKRRPQASSRRLMLLLAASTPAIAAFQNDFSGYPAGAQDCLYDAADSSNCSGDTAQEMNSCLCSNGGSFITNSGTCIAGADSGDMRSTWVRVETSRKDSN